MPTTIIINQTRYSAHTRYDLAVGGELIGSYTQYAGSTAATYRIPGGAGAVVDGPLDAITAITKAAGLSGAPCEPGVVRVFDQGADFDPMGGLDARIVSDLEGLGELREWSTPGGDAGLYVELGFDAEFATAEAAGGLARRLRLAAAAVERASVPYGNLD